MSPNLEISTVIGCKMNCDYCPQKIHVRNYSKRDSKFVMKLAEFKKMLSTVPKNVEIVFAGMAEPWLNPECTDMVLHADHEGYKIGVYTTLVGMRVEDLSSLQMVNFSFITLHLPDANNLMHLKVTDEYLSLLIVFLNKFPYAQKMVIGKLHEEVEEITGPVIDHSAGLYSRAGNLPLLSIARKPGILECSACGPKIDHNVLLPNGDVLLCCQDYGQEHVIGNLLGMPYEQIFHTSEYARVMDGLKDETQNIICRKCELSKVI